MKKIIALMLCAVVLLSLCACGKSKEAQNVDDLILAIGEVSIDSAEKIAVRSWLFLLAVKADNIQIIQPVDRNFDGIIAVSSAKFLARGQIAIQADIADTLCQFLFCNQVDVIIVQRV